MHTKGLVPEASPCNKFRPSVCRSLDDVMHLATSRQKDNRQWKYIVAVIIQALIALVTLNYVIGPHAKSAKFEFQIDK